MKPVKLGSVKALASSGLLAILAVTASSVLWSLSTSFKKSLSSVLSVLTICWKPKETIAFGFCSRIHSISTLINATSFHHFEYFCLQAFPVFSVS
jgi:hypothetical protein